MSANNPATDSIKGMMKAQLFSVDSNKSKEKSVNSKHKSKPVNNIALLSKEKLSKESIRSHLQKVNYDSSLFIEKYCNITQDIDSSEAGLELHLKNLFHDILQGLHEVSNEIEKEKITFKKKSETSQIQLMKDLEVQKTELESVQGDVKNLLNEFHKSSEVAMKIGDKLSKADHEKNRIESSALLLTYIEYFEETFSKKEKQEELSKILSLSVEQLRNLLPIALRGKDWGYISKIIQDIRRILLDINSEDVQNAQNSVLKISNAIESELLQNFEVNFTNLMDSILKNQDDSSLHHERVKYIQQCHILVQCLYLFNDGDNLHKRYIYCVIEKRIPINLTQKIQFEPNVWTKLGNLVKSKLKDFNVDLINDDNSSEGAPDDFDTENLLESIIIDDEVEKKPKLSSTTPLKGLLSLFDNKDKQVNNNITLDEQHQLGLTDQLSELFGTIGFVCQEQFAVIQMIFPFNHIGKVTRSLIQRIFCDPAFGIQTRIEGVLSPKSSSHSLELSDYIQALVIVRQKLTGLYYILLDHLTNKTMIEAIIQSSSNNNSSSLVSEEVEDRIKVENDIKAFLKDQISQVLSNYVIDYFEVKELVYVKQQFNESLKLALDEIDSKFTILSKVSSGSLFTLPTIKAEKIKSVNLLLKSIVNKRYLTNIFNIILDSIHRIIIISGQDQIEEYSSFNTHEGKVMFQYEKFLFDLKELFTILLGFLLDSLLIPCSQACTLLILKKTSTSSFNSMGNTIASSEVLSLLPPLDYIELLSNLYWTINKLNIFFKEQYIDLLISSSSSSSSSSNTSSTTGSNPNTYISSLTSNTLAVCKEMKRKSLISLDKVTKESIHAWIIGIGNFMDKLFIGLYNRSDYNPKNLDPLGVVNPKFMESIAIVGNKLNGTRIQVNHSSNVLLNTSIPGIMQTSDDNIIHSIEEVTNKYEVSNCCIQITKALIFVVNQIKEFQELNEWVGLDVKEIFWKPIGRQVIGCLISHLRKQKISVEGAKYLAKDLDLFHKTLSLFEVPENIDMILCLKEICKVFTMQADDVSKFVLEGLRHLDTSIVLTLVRARADFSLKGVSHWSKQIIMALGTIKWDASMPWEAYKNMTIVSFAQSAIGGSNSPALGPSTLRKFSTSLASINSIFVSNKQSNIDHSDSKVSKLTNTTINEESMSSQNILMKMKNTNTFTSSFIPARPEDSMKVDNMLTNTNTNNAYDFIQQNALSALLDKEEKKHAFEQEQKKNQTTQMPIQKIQDIIGKVGDIAEKFQDKAQEFTKSNKEFVFESTNNILANIKTTNVPISGLAKGAIATTTTSNTSGGSTLFDKDKIKNIFTSPLTSTSHVHLNKDKTNASNSTTNKSHPNSNSSSNSNNKNQIFHVAPK